jgi:hypothetical protein
VKLSAQGLAAGAAVAVVALGAVLLVAVATESSPRTPPLPASGILARATLAPRAAQFGDTVVLRVNALVDRGRFRPATLEIGGRFLPYEPDGLPVTTARDVGGATKLVTTLRLTCLSRGCLPPSPLQGGARTFVFAPVHLSIRTRSGASASMSLPVPALQVASRMTPQDVAQSAGARVPPFHVDTSLGWMRFARSPALVFALLVAAAAVLLAVAALLAYRYAPRFAKRPVPVTPLQQALALVQTTGAEGVPPEQRRALELLADALRTSGSQGLATSAQSLAWSEPVPEREETDAFVERIRESLDVPMNGHGR